MLLLCIMDGIFATLFSTVWFHVSISSK